MRKWTRTLLLAMSIAAFNTGCGMQGETRHIFGATYMSRNNPYFDVLNNAIAESVEANGDKLIVRDSLQDQSKQNEQIYDLIEEGIEILFLNPVDRKAVKPALEACKKAGVKIINIDTQVENTEYILSTIETDHYQAGQKCAEDMMTRMDQAEIIIIDNPDQMSVKMRVQGFLDKIKGNDNYKVVSWDVGRSEIEVATKVVADSLKKDLKFDVIFGGNDPMALGALAALQQAGKDENVLIYGVDGSPDFKAMIDLGYVTGTSSQSPITIGKTAVEIAYDALEGKEVKTYIKLPSTLITKENLAHYDIDGWQ